MFNHCKPYICDILRRVPAVFLILLGFLYAYSDSEITIVRRPRIALLGDSMTWIGGDSCQNPTGWTHTLKECGIAEKIEVYARSGATWTNTKSTGRNLDHYTEVLHDDNVIYNQALRLIKNADCSNENPDIIVLFAGANDAWFAAKRPGLYDKEDVTVEYTLDTDPAEVTTLEGSIRLVCDILKYRFSNASLLFVTPLQMSKTDAETIFNVSDIIEKTASEKGWLSLRADKDTGIKHQQEAKSPTFTYDGVHTNPAGARLLGKYITSHIQALSSYPNIKNRKLITDN